MPSLWSRCELSTENLTTFKNKDKFYVDKLMPPICVSRFVVGSNIKKVESIPGRRQSTYKGIAEMTEVNLTDISEASSVRTDCIQHTLDYKMKSRSMHRTKLKQAMLISYIRINGVDL